MYEKLADLLLYGRLEGDGAVLTELGDLWRDWQRGGAPREELLRRAHGLARRLLELAVGWGLDGNLWQGYLTYVLIGDENPYTLSVERGRTEAAPCPSWPAGSGNIPAAVYPGFWPAGDGIGDGLLFRPVPVPGPGRDGEGAGPDGGEAGRRPGRRSQRRGIFPAADGILPPPGPGTAGPVQGLPGPETERGEAALEPVADGEEMTLARAGWLPGAEGGTAGQYPGPAPGPALQRRAALRGCRYRQVLPVSGPCCRSLPGTACG